ncbi:MAG: hypothetical protein ACREO8_12730 [Luteimonas sp.]
MNPHAHHRSRLVVALLAVVALSACRDRAADAADAAAQAVAVAAANEQSAKQNADGFDAAAAREDWRMAKAQADVLLARFPDTDAAKRIRPRYDDVKRKSDAAKETLRTAALWSYNIESVEGGKQLSAAIYSREQVDTDGRGAAPVRLIFRDHPSWGDSSYLVLETGDFDCYGGCKVRVGIDVAAPKAMAALRPKAKEAIAMFVNDQRALWQMTKDAKTVSIAFPVKAGGTRTAVFEVAGLDRGKLPDWK